MEDTPTSYPSAGIDWCLRCRKQFDDMCRNYRNDCFYYWYGGDSDRYIDISLVMDYFKQLDEMYEEDEEDDLISNEYDSTLSDESVDSPQTESEDSQWEVLPVATRLGLVEQSLNLIEEIGSHDSFFGDVVPDPDPEDVEMYNEITNQRDEEFTEQRRKEKEIADSFVAAFEAWAYDDPEIGVAHLEEEEYHMKPWSFESQEVHSNGNYMELEPEYISTDKADYLNLVLEPDDAILVRYALLESAMYLEDQVWEAEQREDKVIPELLKRGKHTLEIIADMIEAWLESL
jgi:hypothetical protein